MVPLDINFNFLENSSDIPNKLLTKTWSGKNNTGRRHHKSSWRRSVASHRWYRGSSWV